jgi:hypothetical protein
MDRCWLVAVLAVSAPAAAGPALYSFPEEKLRAYAPLLAQGEMAVIETDPEGHAGQVTLLAWAAAPPETVREVVATPERFPKFLHNVSRCDVQRRPDGSLVNTWRVELPIGHFDGQDEYRFAPGPTGAVEVRALGEGKRGLFRWDFLPADGGGTVVVYSGFWDPPIENFLLRRMLARNPAYEAGFALSAGLVLLNGVQAEAARLAGERARKVEPPRPGRAPGFGMLLDRGTLAVVRTDGHGALVDVSVVERITAPVERLLGILRAPEAWPSFLPSVTHCKVERRDPGGLEYRIGINGILLEVETTYRMNFTPSGIDALGVGGDMRGSRFRWDLSPAGAGATLAVYRANGHLGTSSSVLRALFHYEPSFEPSANVGVGVLAMRAVARRARALEAASKQPQ